MKNKEPIYLPSFYETAMEREEKSRRKIDSLLDKVQSFGDDDIAILEGRFLRWARNQNSYGLLKFLLPKEWKDDKKITQAMNDICDKYPELGYSVWIGQAWDAKEVEVKHIYLVRVDPNRPKRSPYCNTGGHDKCPVSDDCSCFCHEVVSLRKKSEEIMRSINERELPVNPEILEEKKKKFESVSRVMRSIREKESRIIPGPFPKNKEEWMAVIMAHFEWVTPEENPNNWDDKNTITVGPVRWNEDFNGRIYAAIRSLNERNAARDLDWEYKTDNNFYKDGKRYLVIYTGFREGRDERKLCPSCLGEGFFEVFEPGKQFKTVKCEECSGTGSLFAKE